MPGTEESRTAGEPPDWALAAAKDELYDVGDPAALLSRAWEIAREASQLDEERHDEYDDPDEGGEA